MVPEAPLERTEDGLVPAGDGWFVVNAREARWLDRPGRGLRCGFEGEPEFPQLGVSLFVLAPGEPIGITTGRRIRRADRCSKARRCCSWRARNGRSRARTSCTVRRRRT